MQVSNIFSLLRSYGLQSVIYKNYLSSALIPILFIEILLLILYFGINQYMSSENKNTLYLETVNSLEQIIDREAINVDIRLNEVSRLARILQLEHERLFPLGNSCEQPNGDAVFGVHQNGAYHKLKDNGGASLYYSKNTMIGSEEKKKAICSESIDPLLKNIVDTNSIVNQAYINTWDNMNRLYPFMPDAPTQYGPVLVMQDYNFYYLADQEYNPERSAVWTEAYLDPAGLGWMTSVIVPIYYNGKLEGVSGLDVTISTFIDDILNIQLPWVANSLLVDSKGGILAMTEKGEELLGINELTTHKYDSAIRETINKPNEYNILNISNQELREIAKIILIEKGGIYEVEISGEHYILKAGIIPETGWRMLTFVNSDAILTPIIRLKNTGNFIGFLAICTMLIFYVVFFIYLIRKSLILSSQIATPIEKLTKLTTNFGKTFDNQFLDPVGIHEIDQLTSNFNTLNIELSERSDALVQAKVREELLNKEREIFKKLAMYDNLTGLFNRHELNKVLKQKLKNDRHYNHRLGVLLLDIDHFKKVNDTYGHQAGDCVLKKLATILKKQTRQTDIVGRWGGEEFLIICPEIDMDGLSNLAEKICSYIELNSFDEVGKITVSIGGCNHLQSENSVSSIINNADLALYEAKNNGRNQWVIFKDEIII
ncbi:diguanylate cyclase [Photobacterium frigidiphilum]|uniref:diguanylate cyclase n=1 Tax=Photobacterium frigidiphilum TaxID=264736 RepID=UPI003D0E9C9A